MSGRSVSAKVRRKQGRKQKTALLEEMRQWVADPLGVESLRELLRESLRGFAIEAGTRVALCLLQDEVSQLCGPEYQRSPGRELSRYGRQPGVVLLGGRGVPILKPRVRYKDGRGEKTLKTYERLQRPEAISESTLAKMVRDETLTVIRLGLTDGLRRTLATTNPIESVMDTTRTITGRVKHWQDGAMRQRWCASGLLKAEQRFRRVKGYKDIPKLIAALDAIRAKSSSDSTTKPKTKPKSNSK